MYCFIKSYKLHLALYFGDFGWSAGALIALILLIQILYDESIAIIQFKVLKLVEHMTM